MVSPSEYLNGLEASAGRRELFRCCGSERWVDAMLLGRPFSSDAALKQYALAIWQDLDPQEQLSAFAQHPEIGADLGKLRDRFPESASWSSREQAGVQGAEQDILEALRDANLAYRARFGFLFIVCATGKSAREMLSLLRERMHNTPAREREVAAQEQAKITALRLDRLGS